jgi:hypothetical protein
MNEKINASVRKKLILTVLVCIFIISSCKKENVCSLTPEQSPEIRGFKLGMSYDAIVKRFPEACKPYIEKQGKFNVNFYFGHGEKSTCEADDSGIAGYNLLHENHSDFDGVKNVELSFSNKLLSDFTIQYDKSTDSNIKSTFEEKTIESLDLSKWTNWIDNNPPYNAAPHEHLEITYEKTLLCQKILVKTIVEEFIPTDRQELEKNGISYYPSVSVKNVNEEAKTMSQIEQAKKQKDQQERDEYLKKTNEEKKKIDAFRP